MAQNTPDQISDYTPPAYRLDGFHCAHARCGVYSKQSWYFSTVLFSSSDFQGAHFRDDRYHFARCERCGDFTVWKDNQIIYPLISLAPRPHKQMPKEIAPDYEEASKILPNSPRGSAALLRLATEKLALLLVKKAGLTIGKDLNENIGILVSAGLPGTIQKALDTLRVIGNDAVHPGMLDLKDDQDTATKLFRLLNVIVDNRIAQVVEIESLYADKVPESKKQGIEQRDA